MKIMISISNTSNNFIINDILNIIYSVNTNIIILFSLISYFNFSITKNRPYLIEFF